MSSFENNFTVYKDSGSRGNPDPDQVEGLLESEEGLGPYNSSEERGGYPFYSNYMKSTSTAPPRSSRLPYKLTTSLSSAEGNRYLGNLRPLPFSRDNQSIVMTELTRIVSYYERPYRNVDIRVSEPVRSHLRRLLISIDGYLESKNPVQTVDDIISAVSQGPEGISFLKKARKKNLIESSAGLPIVEPDWWPTVHTQLINDIGDMFNYNYLLDWELPAEEDWKLGLEPVIQDDDTLFLFRETIRDLLPDRHSFNEVAREEILLRQSSSKSLISSGERHSNWRIKSSFLEFSNEPLRGERCVVHTGPGSDRDTVMLTVNQLNSINWIDAQVRCILQEIPGNCMVDDPSKINKKIIRDGDKFNFFLNRDFKKEGITKPRNLLTIMLEELDLKYPDLKFREVKDIYSGYFLTVDTVEYEMARGHGLGMANSLTTLMQLGIFHATLNVAHQHTDIPSGSASCGAYNDDFYAAFDQDNVMEEYWDIESLITTGLGLVVEPDKSYRADSPTICEIYYKDMNAKESYSRREVLLALCCSSISRAKRHINSLSRSFDDDLLSEYLGEIISYWGYEFSIDEVDQPFSFGGWVSYSGRGVSLDTFFVKESESLLAMYKACHVMPYTKVKCPKNLAYQAPVQKIFNFHEPLPHEEANEIFNIGTPENLIKKFSRVSENSSLRMMSDISCDRRRKEVYMEHRDTVISISELEKLYINDNPTIDIIPYHTGVECRDMQPSQVLFNRTQDFLRSENPRLEYLRYIYPGKFVDRMLPANPLGVILSSHRLINLNKVAEDYRGDVNKISLRTKLDRVEINKFAMHLPEEMYKSFINPQMVCNITSQIEGFRVLTSREVSPEKQRLIELRKEFDIPFEVLIYGSFLGWKELRYVFRELKTEVSIEELCWHLQSEDPNTVSYRLIEAKERELRRQEAEENSDSDDDYPPLPPAVHLQTWEELEGENPLEKIRLAFLSGTKVDSPRVARIVHIFSRVSLAEQFTGPKGIELRKEIAEDSQLLQSMDELLIEYDIVDGKFYFKDNSEEVTFSWDEFG